MHAADVKNVLRVYSIEVAAGKKEDLNEEPIVKRLRSVSSEFNSYQIMTTEQSIL